MKRLWFMSTATIKCITCQRIKNNLKCNKVLDILFWKKKKQCYRKLQSKSLHPSVSNVIRAGVIRKQYRNQEWQWGSVCIEVYVTLSHGKSPVNSLTILVLNYSITTYISNYISELVMTERMCVLPLPMAHLSAFYGLRTKL